MTTQLHTIADFKGLLQRLSPPGPAWSDGGQWEALCDALSLEAARLDYRWQQLMDEMDPRTANETLDLWERMLGIVHPSGSSTAQRRLAAWARMLATGGCSRTYFMELAAASGVPCGITETDPFTFIVTVEWGTPQVEKDALAALLDLCKPAHTTYLMEVAPPP